MSAGVYLWNQIRFISRNLGGYKDRRDVKDTGASHNIINLAYAQRNNLGIHPSQESFTLGSNKNVMSIGTTEILWAFAESPGKTMRIICHVIPHCINDIILGREFLAETQTLSGKHRNRIKKCLFSLSGISQIAAIGDAKQYLRGKLDNGKASGWCTLAMPDTGAECNVISKSFVDQKGFKYLDGPANRNYLRFADGSRRETLGQFIGRWTFASGECIPITFEVLDECCANVIIGEEVLWKHEVFEKHASSIITAREGRGQFELAPFDMIKSWQKKASAIVGPTSHYNHIKDEQNTVAVAQTAEELRRDIYNLKTDFGKDASPTERELEVERRAAYLERVQEAAHRRKREPRISGLLSRIGHRFKQRASLDSPQLLR